MVHVTATHWKHNCHTRHCCPTCATTGSRESASPVSYSRSSTFFRYSIESAKAGHGWNSDYVVELQQCGLFAYSFQSVIAAGMRAMQMEGGKSMSSGAAASHVQPAGRRSSAQRKSAGARTAVYNMQEASQAGLGLTLLARQPHALNLPLQVAHRLLERLWPHVKEACH